MKHKKHIALLLSLLLILSLLTACGGKKTEEESQASVTLPSLELPAGSEDRSAESSAPGASAEADGTVPVPDTPPKGQTETGTKETGSEKETDPAPSESSGGQTPKPTGGGQLPIGPTQPAPSGQAGDDDVPGNDDSSEDLPDNGPFDDTGEDLP